MGKLQNFVDNTNAFAEKVGDDVKLLKQRQDDLIDDQQSSADSTYSSQHINSRLGDKVDKVPGYGLSEESFSRDEKDKLAALEGSKYKGSYTSLAALNTAHPTAEAGASADVDEGAGNKVVRYVWDVSDGEWVAQSGESTQLTGAQVKQLYESQPDTNAFTDAKSNKLDNIEAGAQANTVTSVAGKTGAVTVTKTDVGLGSVQNYPIANQLQAQGGSANNVYMTPEGTEDYVDGQIGDDDPLAIYNAAAGN